MQRKKALRTTCESQRIKDEDKHDIVREAQHARQGGVVCKEDGGVHLSNMEVYLGRSFFRSCVILKVLSLFVWIKR